MSTMQPAPGDEPTDKTGGKPGGADGPGEEHPRTEPSEPAGKKAGDDPLRGSRTSGLYAAVVGLGVLLVLLIIFIAQNTDTTTVRFLSFEGETPVAVAMLIATTAGILLTATAGSLRIIQLRRRTKKDIKQR
ncbi:lipopolysaccharide assembly protein LapA domain-containing protein [Nocardioides sp. SOB44]|uniref:Lipopolysaccharide assembly protein LapA domain-containing protein n=1 Tax=Nocardioides cremeus TaxID=3058044 RepID=A0ABT8TTS3_9ACTN|nr:lipopolysaccharide assembly protein LapA domain-containing protein [Nocardioides cremeus]MDO3396840.1 lipopolysaccharide assembly protein LapA domain-containing protein [Nocardioides cremeus]